MVSPCDTTSRCSDHRRRPRPDLQPLERDNTINTAPKTSDISLAALAKSVHNLPRNMGNSKISSTNNIGDGRLGKLLMIHKRT